MDVTLGSALGCTRRGVMSCGAWLRRGVNDGVKKPVIHALCLGLGCLLVTRCYGHGACWAHSWLVGCSTTHAASGCARTRESVDVACGVAPVCGECALFCPVASTRYLLAPGAELQTTGLTADALVVDQRRGVVFGPVKRLGRLRTVSCDVTVMSHKFVSCVSSFMRLRTNIRSYIHNCSNVGE